MNEIIDKGQAPETTVRRKSRVHTFEQHYTIKDACDLLSIKRRTIYKWISSGVIPFVVKTPGGTRIPASALNQFAESRRIVTCQRYTMKC